MAPLNDGSIWKMEGNPLLARWTTDFDCDYETSWWYVIKDEPFDLMGIPSKKRYEINKGKKNFDIRVVEPQKYVNEIYEVTLAAFLSWPEKYRPILSEEKFKAGIMEWNEKKVFAAFEKENGVLVGYAYLTEYSGYADFNLLRVNPEYEKKE